MEKVVHFTLGELKESFRDIVIEATMKDRQTQSNMFNEFKQKLDKHTIELVEFRTEVNGKLNQITKDQIDQSIRLKENEESVKSLDISRAKNEGGTSIINILWTSAIALLAAFITVYFIKK